MTARFLKQIVFLSAALAILGCSSGSNSTVTKVPVTPTITWAAPASVTYGTALSSIQLDASSGGVAGTFAYSPVIGTVLAAGSQTLSVTFTPTDTADYTTASGSVTLTVNKATPVITWTPTALIVGSALGSSQLNASAGSVAGVFAYTPVSGTLESTVGNIPLSTVFTPTDTTDYTTTNGSATLTVLSANATIIDFGTTKQTIRGFGGSTAWMPPMSTAQSNALFGMVGSQLGLSILRVRIDPSSISGGANWSTELINAQEAQAAGTDVSVFATPWTPPAAWKSNDSTVMGSLNTSEYAAYAAYLESFVTYFAKGGGASGSAGVNLYAISMQNEPDANVSYESCVWTGLQMDTWVANNSSVLTTKLMMPESESFTTSYSDPALDDANAVENISIVAGHLYGASPFYYTNAENMGKEVWETEHYLSPAGAQPVMADAIAAAEEIHQSMTVGQYNAYLWWWLADWNPGTGVTNYGLIDTNSGPTYYGLAIAQFSKFVRPGYLRVNVPTSPTAGVYVSAYEGEGHSVIVAINSNASATSLPILIENQPVTTLTPYQTTASGGMATLSSVSVSGDTFTYLLPAQSITTFVQ